MTDHVSFDLFLKATPAEEGGDRIIYFEASNEGVDQQGERVLAKALAESAAIFKAHGNIDIDHLSLLRKGTQVGIESEIGFPVDAVVNDKRNKSAQPTRRAPGRRIASTMWNQGLGLTRSEVRGKVTLLACLVVHPCAMNRASYRSCAAYIADQTPMYASCRFLAFTAPLKLG